MAACAQQFGMFWAVDVCSKHVFPICLAAFQLQSQAFTVGDLEVIAKELHAKNRTSLINPHMAPMCVFTRMCGVYLHDLYSLS